MTNTAVLTERSTKHGPSELDREPYLDGWRGLAIGLVLFSHFGPNPGWLDSGRFGVDAFFCLSGLLMAKILFVKHTALGTFYKRRISRVVPVFLTFTLVVYVIGWRVTGSFPWDEFLSTICFLRTYVPATPDIWHADLPISHLWSLNAEEHLYVFFSLVSVLTILKGSEGWVLIGLGIVSIALRVIYVNVPSLVPHSGELGTEVVASYLLISSGYLLVHRRCAWSWAPAVAFLASVLCYTPFVPWWAGMFLSPILLSFVINHLSDAPQFVLRVLSLPGLRLLGIWSYSIYIWQQPFYWFQGHFPVGVAFLLAMLLSIGSFYLFENPVRAWMNKNW